MFTFSQVGLKSKSNVKQRCFEIEDSRKRL